MKKNIEQYTILAGKRYRYRFYLKGKLYQKSGFLKFNEAKEEKYKHYLRVKNQHTENINFKDLVDEYSSYIEIGLKKLTFENYKSIIINRILPMFGEYNINNITPYMINSWQQDLKKQKLSGLYLRKIQNILKAIFRYAEIYKNLQNNPMRYIENIVKVAKQKKYNILTKKEFDLFIENILELEFRVIYIILFYTGIRIGELLGLTWKDVNLKEGRIEINRTRSGDYIGTPKTYNSIRELYICQKVIDAIKEWHNYSISFRDKYVFNIKKPAIEYKLKKTINVIGLKHMRLHDFRHSHVCMLLNLGVDILDISRNLGHKTIKTTVDIYGKSYFGKSDDIAKKLNNL